MSNDNDIRKEWLLLQGDEPAAKLREFFERSGAEDHPDDDHEVKRGKLDYRLGAEHSNIREEFEARFANCRGCGHKFAELKPPKNKGWASVRIVAERPWLDDAAVRAGSELWYWHPECWDAAHPVGD